MAQSVKNLPAVQEARVLWLSRKDPQVRGIAPYSSILAREIPWTEETGGLQSMGFAGDRQDLATKPPHPRSSPNLHFHLFHYSYLISCPTPLFLEIWSSAMPKKIGHCLISRTQ